MNNRTRGGLLALLVLGGYLLYRNRTTIQRSLEARGIKTPLDTSGKLRDTIRSGIAKLSGRTQYIAREVKDEAENKLAKAG